MNVTVDHPYDKYSSLQIRPISWAYLVLEQTFVELSCLYQHQID